MFFAKKLDKLMGKIFAIERVKNRQKFGGECRKPERHLLSKLFMLQVKRVFFSEHVGSGFLSVRNLMRRVCDF